MFLDAIDQLNFKDFNLGWIFKHLPPNTKIVYSVINNYENLLTNLELKIKNTNLDLIALRECFINKLLKR